MKKCTLVHLSDLHLTGKKTDSIAVLEQGARAIVAQCSMPLLLVITGDLVESPSARAIAATEQFLDRMKALFGSDIVLVAGNHDRKRMFGSLFRSNAFARHALERHEIVS